jgi:plastocyanin
MTGAKNCVLVLSLLVGADTVAGDLQVQVQDQHGLPVADAVATLRPLPSAAGAGDEQLPVRKPQTKLIDQRDETFIPYVEIFHPQDQVIFHNSDGTRHHVYSFAPSKAFEMVLKPGESSAALLLDKPGTIAVGCNIHDQMISYLVVTDAPLAGKTDASGRLHFDGLPAADYQLHIWHPRLRPGAEVPALSVLLDSSQASAERSFRLQLLPDTRAGADPERVDY